VNSRFEAQSLALRFVVVTYPVRHSKQQTITVKVFPFCVHFYTVTLETGSQYMTIIFQDEEKVVSKQKV